MQSYKFTYIHINKHTYINTYYMQIYIHSCIHTYKHAYIWIYIHSYIQIHTNIQLYISLFFFPLCSIKCWERSLPDNVSPHFVSPTVKSSLSKRTAIQPSIYLPLFKNIWMCKNAWVRVCVCWLGYSSVTGFDVFCHFGKILMSWAKQSWFF